MISTNDLKAGVVLKFGNDLLEVVEFQHVKPGKGPAFVRTRFKNLRTGAIFEKKLGSGDKVENVRIEEKQMEYLYRDGENFVFMDSKNYEQVPVPVKALGEKADFLKENSTVGILFNEHEILGINLPNFVVLKITYTEPGMKGDTVGLTLKDATVETGAKVQVPIFIEAGETVKIDTRTRTYVERVKT